MARPKYEWAFDPGRQAAAREAAGIVLGREFVSRGDGDGEQRIVTYACPDCECTVAKRTEEKTSPCPFCGSRRRTDLFVAKPGLGWSHPGWRWHTFDG